jgi:hypothetical protein
MKNQKETTIEGRKDRWFLKYKSYHEAFQSLRSGEDAELTDFLNQQFVNYPHCKTHKTLFAIIKKELELIYE